MEQIKPFAAITQEQIQDWKAKYGDNLNEITVGDYKYVVKMPDRRTVDLVAQCKAKNEIVAANNTIFKNCVLGGDMDEADQNGIVYSDLLAGIVRLFQHKDAIVKKL